MLEEVSAPSAQYIPPYLVTPPVPPVDESAIAESDAETVEYAEAPATEPVAESISEVVAEPVAEARPVDALKAQLADLEAQAAAVKAQLEEERIKGRIEAVMQVRALVADYGISSDEVFAAPVEKKTRGRKAKSEGGEKVASGERKRVAFRDKVSGAEYRGGRIPQWLVDRMAATGLSLSDYREQHMTRVE